MANEVKEGTDLSDDARRVVDDNVKPVARHANAEVAPRRGSPSKDVIVGKGELYREKEGDLEVIPFFVDTMAAEVRFAPVGRSTEETAKMADFLKRFEKIDKSKLAEASPAESAKNAEAQAKREAPKEDK